MARDALEPSGDGSFPAFPRHPVAGAPLWSPDKAHPDAGYRPRGLVKHVTPDGRVVVIDLTPYDPETGLPIEPPTIPPTP
jgi:hypothetical protein